MSQNNCSITNLVHKGIRIVPIVLLDLPLFPPESVRSRKHLYYFVLELNGVNLKLNVLELSEAPGTLDS